MVFSKEWEQRYRDNTNMSVWPWSDLVSYVKRYAEITNESRILELGCGAGANIPFFLSLGIEYYAIEGSMTMVNELKKKFPDLQENIIADDFTSNIPFSKDFDVIVDRSSLTHNSTNEIIKCLKNIEKKIKPNGKYIGIDWFSTQHTGFNQDDCTVEDMFTRSNFQSGQFKNVGVVHFSDKNHLHELFKNFNFLILEHKIVKKEIPSSKDTFASWNFAVQKK
jgi:SAM-dependent methyltransferase